MIEFSMGHPMETPSRIPDAYLSRRKSLMLLEFPMHFRNGHSLIVRKTYRQNISQITKKNRNRQDGYDRLSYSFLLLEQDL